MCSSWLNRTIRAGAFTGGRRRCMREAFWADRETSSWIPVTPAARRALLLMSLQQPYCCLSALTTPGVEALQCAHARTQRITHQWAPAGQQETSLKIHPPFPVQSCSGCAGTKMARRHRWPTARCPLGSQPPSHSSSPSIQLPAGRQGAAPVTVHRVSGACCKLCNCISPLCSR